MRKLRQIELFGKKGGAELVQNYVDGLTSTPCPFCGHPVAIHTDDLPSAYAWCGWCKKIISIKDLTEV